MGDCIFVDILVTQNNKDQYGFLLKVFEKDIEIIADLCQ
jgi:hypothetical protein